MSSVIDEKKSKKLLEASLVNKQKLYKEGYGIWLHSLGEIIFLLILGLDLSMSNLLPAWLMAELPFTFSVSANIPPPIPDRFLYFQNSYQGLGHIQYWLMLPELHILELERLLYKIFNHFHFSLHIIKKEVLLLLLLQSTL